MWVDAGTETKGSFGTLFPKKKTEFYITFNEKKSAFAERKEITTAQEFDIQVFRG